MCCGDEKPGMNCRVAVVRAYGEMRSAGQPDRFCLEAAIEVYRWHHPEIPDPETTVSRWVYQGQPH